MYVCIYIYAHIPVSYIHRHIRGLRSFFALLLPALAAAVAVVARGEAGQEGGANAVPVVKVVTVCSGRCRRRCWSCCSAHAGM